MNVAIIGNSYYEKLLCYSIKHIYCNCEQVCLLRENHNQLDMTTEEIGVNVVYFDTLDSMVSVADVVLLINIANTKNNDQKIIQTVSQSKKFVINIDNLDAITRHSEIDYNQLKENNYIISLSIGMHTHQLFTEILLNRIMRSYNISIHQVYSYNTNYVLHRLSVHPDFNKGLLKHNNAQYDIGLIGLQLEDISEFVNGNIIYNIFQAVKPIMIIVDYSITEGADNVLVDEIQKTVKYKFGIENCLMIKSSFEHIGKNKEIVFNKNNAYNKNILENNIIQLLFFPEDIKPL